MSVEIAPDFFTVDVWTGRELTRFCRALPDRAVDAQGRGLWDVPNNRRGR
jgi:hypothetical protein